jgi:hypothetical protein
MITNRFLNIGWFTDRVFGLNLTKMGYKSQD